MFSLSLEIIIAPFCFTKLPSLSFTGAPFSVPIPTIKTTIFFSLAKAISSEKSFLSPPSLKSSRYFLFSFLIELSTTFRIDKKSVPFSVIEFVLNCCSKKLTALWSKLSGETR